MSRYKTDATLLEQYRVALNNATTNTDIATALTEIGFDETVINEGKALLQSARQAFEVNQTEDDETTQAYATFQERKDTLSATYGKHRKKARVIFRNDAVNTDALALKGEMPQAYIPWLETIKKFYTTADASEDIKTKLGRLSIVAEDITNALTAITELEAARTIYLRERGESQEATQAKDKALSNLGSWMSDFYAVARIALEDQPQLLEVLGKTVRS